MKRYALVLAVLAASLCVAMMGCRKGVPIVEPHNGALASYGNLSKPAVRDAIIRAGSGIGWQMHEEKPGLIVGAWKARDHSATVEIPYSNKEYAIKYRSSENLLEGEGTIHSNYNRWVERLNRNIAAELSKTKK